MLWLSVCFVCTLPDGTVGDIRVLGVDASHHGSPWRVLLHLEAVTGSHEGWRLVCVFHRDFHHRRVFIRPPTDEARVHVRVRRLYLQRVRPLRLKVHVLEI